MKPPHDVRQYFYDIARACELLHRFITGKTLDDYSADPLLRSGVERQFGIIGEALNQALRIDPELKSRISDTEKIISLRNRLIHAYFAVSNETIWGILEINLPVLTKEIQTLLDEYTSG